MNGGAVTLIYDGDGNRVAKSVNGVTTRYLIDDLNPTGLPQVVEELVNDAVQRQYTYGLQLISENQLISNTWTASFYETDGAGNVRQLTNSTGAVTDSYEYDAFGNEVNSTGSTSNNYLYRGEQWDPDLGMYYLRHRYYNPVTGRFLSADPLANEGQRRYEYAGADPVNGLDPTGNEDIVEWALLTFYPGRLSVHFPGFPGWCGIPGIGSYLPGCGGGSGNGGGTGAGSGAPGGPPNPPCTGIDCEHWTVKVDWRPLYAQSNPRDSSDPGTKYGLLGHWRHTFVEIDQPSGEEDTWGVLGIDANNLFMKGKNQEVVENDARNPLDGGATGGSIVVQSTDNQAQSFKNALDATTFPGSVCPSCGTNYRNWWWRFDGFNSNTYTEGVKHFV
jgi:RHS repeat-associated protein